ncbi:MAG: translation elongation factor Ts [Erysipelotrichaceae bacterium]|nr:translation elongation factor Ts [Erysipelotrichaceae bacterium]
MAITAQSVKELREKTGAGMMDCKKALTECDGDIAKAIDWLREKGIAKAAKKSDRIAAEGLSRVAVNGNTALIFEVNSETDFVAKNEQFLNVLDTIEATLLANKPASIEAALSTEVEGDTLETIIANATATIGEKISLRRFEIVEKADDEVFGSYMHMGGRISALTVLKGDASAEVAKDIAMQVASMAPAYVSRNEMPTSVVEHERNIQLEILKNDEKLAGKPEKVLEGIVEGRVSKNLKDMCLVEQEFFKNPDIKIGQYVKEAKAEIVSFLRYAVGEGIEKREDNFAEEVMNQAFGK